MDFLYTAWASYQGKCIFWATEWGRDISIYERLSFGFPFFKNVFSYTIHSNCIFPVLYFSPLLFPCPHPLLLCFPSEKNRPLRDINQKGKTSYISLSTNPHLKGEWCNLEGAKGSQEQAKEPEVLPLPLLAVLGFFFSGGGDIRRALQVVSQYSSTVLHAQDPFYYDPVTRKELNSTLHQTSSQTATFLLQ